MTEVTFWQAVDALVEAHTIIIDRPCGTAHPRYPDLIYPLDYGYLKDTHSGDDGGIDVWIGSLPERRICAVVMTVDRKKMEVEMKLLLGCTKQEQHLALHMHQRGLQSATLVERPHFPFTQGEER